MDAYDAQTIEEKWQAVWDEERAFAVENPTPGGVLPEPHFYMLEMLPVPVRQPAHGARSQLHAG